MYPTNPTTHPTPNYSWDLPRCCGNFPCELEHLITQFASQAIESQNTIEELGKQPSSNLSKQMDSAKWQKKCSELAFFDISNMSLVSRQNFYYSLKKCINITQIPIIATCTGVNGMSYQLKEGFNNEELSYPPTKEQLVENGEKKELNGNDYFKLYVEGALQARLKRKPGIGAKTKGKTIFSFHPKNLSDEDIAEVILSHGMIGVSLDPKRIGLASNPKVYLNEAEFSALFPGVKLEHLSGNTHQTTDSSLNGHEPLLNSPNLPEFSRSYLRHLCNNLLHIAKVGGQLVREGELVGKNIWNQIFIGFNPAYVFNENYHVNYLASLEALEKELLHCIKEMAMEGMKGVDDYDYFLDPYNMLEIENLLTRITYTNKVNFYKDYIRSQRILE